MTAAGLAVLLGVAAAAATSSGKGVGPETVDNFSGYVTVNGTRNLFYWFFESRGSPSTDPLILWMTGGPGCSGMLALFVENGPYHVGKAGDLSLNPYAWNSKANMLFIDQPVGAGFSYDTNPLDIGVTNEHQMAANMWEFFQTWFKAHSKYASLPFFIAAESYGGHYAPALAYHVQRQNLAGAGHKINLKGVLIGDGLVDPVNQYPSYPTYVREHQKQLGIKDATIDLMEAGLATCLPLARACGGYNTTCQSCRSPVGPDLTCKPPTDDPKGLPCCLNSDGIPCTNQTLRYLACQNAYDYCTWGELLPIATAGINLYDVTKPCTKPPLCYDFSNESAWLNDKKNIAAIGAKKTSWPMCNRVVELKLVFAGDWMLSFSGAVRSLLEAGVPMLIYHGENDIIVNWMGGKAWTDKLKWSGSAGFASAKNTTYMVDGKDVGTFKSYEGLTFMKLRGAGHLVPMDQPKTALDMVDKFLMGQPFSPTTPSKLAIVV